MSNKSLYVSAGAFGLLLSSAGHAQLPVAGEPVASAPPAIAAQPVDQRADYGGNVAFTVAATGGALRYQWRKDGAKLADYGNVAGAQTEILKLVGVAQSDAGGYSVLIWNPLGVATSAVALLRVNSTVIFSDDFESGALTNWTAFSELPGLGQAFRQADRLANLTAISRGGLSPDAVRLTNSPAQNRTPGGSRSAGISSSRDKMFHKLGMELASKAKATFWVYDDGNPTRCYGELRGTGLNLHRDKRRSLDGCGAVHAQHELH